MPRHKKHKQSAIQHAIGYCRKSTDTEDKQVRSLDDQEKLIREYYDGDDLQMYTESRSAFHPGRPVFDEIMKMVEQGKVSRVIVLEPNRLSRNPQDTGKLIQFLTEGVLDCVDTVIESKQYSRKDSSQLFMLLLQGAMGWKESVDKGERVKVAMEEKAKEGGSTGWAALGYRNAGDIKGEKWIEPDPNIAPKVTRLFELAATGAYSISDLVGEAALMGLNTRSTRRNPGGCSLQKSSLHGMLTNPEYKGVKRYKGELHQGSHKAIVKTEVFDRTQIALASRNTLSTRTKKDALRELFVMAGCVRCGSCKTRTMSPYRAKKGKYILYECKNPNTSCRNCINQEDLLQQLETALNQLQINDDDHEYMRDAMSVEHEKRIGNVRQRRELLEKEYDGIEHQIADLFEQRTKAQLMGMEEAIDKRLEALKEKRDLLQRTKVELHDTGNDWIEHVIKCFGLVKLTQEALKYGTPQVRQAILKSLASDYYVVDKKLVVDWVSPFKERYGNGDRSVWLPGSDSNRRPIR